jgi:hypothetical protein
MDVYFYYFITTIINIGIYVFCVSTVFSKSCVHIHTHAHAHMYMHTAKQGDGDSLYFILVFTLGFVDRHQA